MAEERRRRKRGRRRGRGQPSGERPEETLKEGQPEVDGQPEVVEESEAPGVLPSRLRFRFGRRGGGEGEKQRERRDQDREERPTAATPAHVSPLSFWRKGRTRTYREQPVPRQTLGGTWRRIRRLRFPPWVPVAFIIAVVFGILLILFIEPWGEGDPPHVNDYWQATYSVEICGQGQPAFPEWGGGVNTYGDGVIHLHPRVASEEGKGARLVKWFEYGRGKLTQTEMRMPGTSEEYKNGDTCDDGSEAVLQVFVNGVKMDDWSDYIPQNGDVVRIEFGPEDEPEEAGEAEATEEPGETQATEEPEATEVPQEEAG